MEQRVGIGSPFSLAMTAKERHSFQRTTFMTRIPNFGFIARAATEAGNQVKGNDFTKSAGNSFLFRGGPNAPQNMRRKEYKKSALQHVSRVNCILKWDSLSQIFRQ